MLNQTAHQSEVINRREFLFYLWGASAIVLGVGVCGALAWIATPRRTISKEGLIKLLPSEIPESPIPMGYPNAYSQLNGNLPFWLSNSDHGLLALVPHCTREGCYFKWSPQGFPGHEFPHFVCPCCGSQYTKEGVVITGAPRNLDSFVISVTTPGGITRTPTTGGPISIQNAVEVVIDTHNLIFGKPRPGMSPVDPNLYANHIFGE